MPFPEGQVAGGRRYGEGMADGPPSSRRGPSPLRFVQATLVALCVVMALVWFLLSRAPRATEDPGTTAATGVDTTEAVEGRPVPDVVIEGLDGPDIRLRDLAGRPVVLNFWASSCAPCIKEMPLLQDAATDLEGEVSFVGIDVQEAVEPGREMVERTGVTFPQGRDPRGTLIRQFGGIQLPHTVVIGADGRVVSLNNRVLRSREDLDELLADAR